MREKGWGEEKLRREKYTINTALQRVAWHGMGLNEDDTPDVAGTLLDDIGYLRQGTDRLGGRAWKDD